MILPPPPPGPSDSPWQRYLDRTHAARDGYLAVVSHAHHEYLTGPYPDRDAYTHVERQAWTVYYQAGRDAWRIYDRETTPRTAPAPAPAPDSHPYPDSDGPQAPAPGKGETLTQVLWRWLEGYYGLNCLECGIPWREPSPGCRHQYNDAHPRPDDQSAPGLTESGS